MRLKEIAVVLYYLAVCVSILAFTLIVPFQQAEGEGIAYTNMLFLEYKKANNLVYVDENNESVKQILRSGHVFERTKYKELSGKFGLIICAVALLLTWLLPFTRLHDVIWIGGGFTTLYALGSLNTEVVAGIWLLVFVTYLLKKRRIASNKEKNSTS
jgi:hypothetical protein